MKRRVVVTGLGAVTPLGLNVKTSWNKLVSGACGITKLKDLSGYEKIPCQIAASIPHGSGSEEFNLINHVSKSEARIMSMSTVYGLVACSEALEDAQWLPKSQKSKERTGVCIGVGMSDLTTIYEAADALKQGYSKVSPFFVPKILPNMAAGHVSIKYGFHGPNHTVSTACATGCHAIGDAFKFIQNNFADVMVCGGSEASINPLAMAGFCRLRALCTSCNDSPQIASKPFDKTRDGFVMGEGSAILILEELNHALERGSKIYAEILGYGLSGDASHITAPHESGVGAVLAMQRAIIDANLKPPDITYINAHATSTPLGDAIELKAITSVFGDSVKTLSVSSTKGAHGHLLGAAGNLESLFTVLACHESILPPTINLNDKCEEGADINCISNVSQKWNSTKKVALKNSFGFGGTNACLCIGEYVP
uniref:3-oxoacyl-[acyl-carrier-protein] synthase n=1 Tax=Riptortus pedestris TaxID=329032 RepID=R4WJP8_RIPPE|nr:3-oxoacyl-[acyl-carrier-protein] synthase [Riptortus pedestris]